MSGFDSSFRTDAMLAPYQMADAQAKTQGIANIGTAAVQAAELMQRGAVARAQIASFQQTQQLDTYKLQQMQALDQAAISRHGVTIYEVQADMAVLERNMKQAAVKTSEVDYNTRLTQLALSVGMKADINTGKVEEFKTPEELAEATAQFQSAHYRDQSYSPGLAESRRTSEIAKLQQMVLEGEPDVQAWAQNRLQQLVGGGAPQQPQAQQAPGPQSTPTANPTSQPPQQAQQNNSPAYNSPVWQQSPFWSGAITSDYDKQRMSAGVDRFVHHFMSKRPGFSQEVAYQQVMEQAQQHPLTMATLLAMTGIEDEEIEQRLKVLFPAEPAVRIKDTMALLKADIGRITGVK